MRFAQLVAQPAPRAAWSGGARWRQSRADRGCATRLTPGGPRTNRGWVTDIERADPKSSLGNVSTLRASVALSA